MLTRKNNFLVVKFLLEIQRGRIIAVSTRHVAEGRNGRGHIGHSFENLFKFSGVLNPKK